MLQFLHHFQLHKQKGSIYKMNTSSSYDSVSYAEYIWLDGSQPSQNLRSKTRVLEKNPSVDSITFFPEWSFDGSSTGQAEGHSSDCLLKPVFFCIDPQRGQGSYLVLCEVLNPDTSAHASNQRAKLKRFLKTLPKDTDAWIGFEQEYTLFDGNTPLGWPENGFPAPQGPFYCGVGTNRVFGRDIAEQHREACAKAGLSIYGINAEVMPGQWEFQLGYRGFKGEKADPLTISDQMWVARYLLCLTAEKFSVSVSFENKPVKGDWNGAGMHTNFSTKKMRAANGLTAIESAIENLGEKHSEHIPLYGAGLAERLTGLHETCDITEFKSGVSHRGASIRIPIVTAQKKCGYFEDRRPGANADPYLVSSCLIESIANTNVTQTSRESQPTLG